jgi:hypothetical protein
MKPLDELRRDLAHHTIMCRCGGCKEYFWRTCVERGGFAREDLDRILDLFELHRHWAWELLDVVQRTAQLRADLEEQGVPVSISVAWK